MQRKLNIFLKKFDNVRFFQGDDKRGENHWGMWIILGMPMGRLSVLSTPVVGSGVTAHTRRWVFLILFSPQPLTEQSHNKRSNSLYEKLSFKSTNNKFVIRGMKPIHIFRSQRLSRALPERAWLRHPMGYKPQCPLTSARERHNWSIWHLNLCLSTMCYLWRMPSTKLMRTVKQRYAFNRLV